MSERNEFGNKFISERMSLYGLPIYAGKTPSHRREAGSRYGGDKNVAMDWRE